MALSRFEISDWQDIIGERKGDDKTTGGVAVAKIELSEEDRRRYEELALEEEPEITVFGKKCRMHRHVAQYGPQYNFSGSKLKNQPLPAFLRLLMAAINRQLGTNYNGCLVNKYLDGRHCIGAHSDDEHGLDPLMGVACIAWGQPRKLRFRKKGEKGFVDFVPGDREPHLILMWGTFNDEYTHEITKQLRITGEEASRTSLTFRCHTE